MPDQESRQWQWLAQQEAPADSPNRWVSEGGDEENFCRMLSTVSRRFTPHTRTILHVVLRKRRRHLTSSPRMKSKPHPNLVTDLSFPVVHRGYVPSSRQSTCTSPVVVPHRRPWIHTMSVVASVGTDYYCRSPSYARRYWPIGAGVEPDKNRAVLFKLKETLPRRGYYTFASPILPCPRRWFVCICTSLVPGSPPRELPPVLHLIPAVYALVCNAS